MTVTNTYDAAYVGDDCLEMPGLFTTMNAVRQEAEDFRPDATYGAKTGPMGRASGLKGPMVDSDPGRTTRTFAELLGGDRSDLDEVVSRGFRHRHDSDQAPDGDPRDDGSKGQRRVGRGTVSGVDGEFEQERERFTFEKGMHPGTVSEENRRRMGIHNGDLPGAPTSIEAEAESAPLPPNHGSGMAGDPMHVGPLKANDNEDECDCETDYDCECDETENARYSTRNAVNNDLLEVPSMWR